METATCKRPTRRSRRAPLVALKALRVNAGLSRESLAFKTGVSRETIRLAESGYLPTPRVQFALAAAFDMRPLDIWPIERQGAGR